MPVRLTRDEVAALTTEELVEYVTSAHRRFEEAAEDLIHAFQLGGRDGQAGFLYGVLCVLAGNTANQKDYAEHGASLAKAEMARLQEVGWPPHSWLA